MKKRGEGVDGDGVGVRVGWGWGGGGGGMSTGSAVPPCGVSLCPLLGDVLQVLQVLLCKPGSQAGFYISSLVRISVCSFLVSLRPVFYICTLLYSVQTGIFFTLLKLYSSFGFNIFT